MSQGIWEYIYFWLRPRRSPICLNVCLSVCIYVCIYGRIPQLDSPLTNTGSGAHGPVVFELTLDREDLEMENHDEKTNCSSWQYLSFGTGLIEIRLSEVDL